VLFVELHVDRLGFALLSSAPHYPSKRTRLDVSFLLISAYKFTAGVEEAPRKGE